MARSDTAQLKARFEAIPQAIRDAVRPAMEKSAQEIVDMMKSICPVDSGQLRDSIGWTWGEAPGATIKLSTIDAEGFSITIYAGDVNAYYAHFVEYGTVEQAAQAFFFPSIRLLKPKALNRIKRATNTAVKAAWAGKL